MQTPAQIARAIADTATQYAVYQDAGPIYGIGATQEAAYADAAEWAENAASLDAAPITPALAAIVADRGGAVRYELIGARWGVPVLCTDAEGEAYYDAQVA